MKTLIQKIHLNENQSFACRTYITPHFETNWHMHEEYELIVITRGTGTAMIGDYVGEYNPGDVYFLTSNLPHWFRKSNSKIIGSAIVVHFNRNVLGEHFLAIPEMKAVAQLLNKNNGIQLVKGMRKEMAETIPLIEKATGFQRLNLLLQSLQKIANTNQYQLLTLNFAEADNKVNPAIEKIIDYSFKHYLNAITLQEVAAVAQMSIPTFCRFFKKNIKKTYFEFLQDIRISHACKLLNSTNKPIMEICYESGYNSWAHFSKQFKEIKATTPSQYRKQFEV
jgi:AraC-like DNA-binding protein/quercetin dioxygenase-like cupin family protein